MLKYRWLVSVATGVVVMGNGTILDEFLSDRLVVSWSDERVGSGGLGGSIEGVVAAKDAENSGLSTAIVACLWCCCSGGTLG